MEVKKITEGMTAPQVAQVIDDNFKAQNKILEEDIAKQNNVIGVSEYKDFSEAEVVNVGDVRKYNGFLYECVEATTGAFDASKWKKSSFKAETGKKLSELGSEVSKINGEPIDIDISDYEVHEGEVDNGNWWIHPYYQHIVIPVVTGQQYTIVSNKNVGFLAYQLEQYNPVDGQPVTALKKNYDDAGQSETFSIVPNAHFLLVFVLRDNSDVTPESVSQTFSGGLLGKLEDNINQELGIIRIDLEKGILNYTGEVDGDETQKHSDFISVKGGEYFYCKSTEKSTSWNTISFYDSSKNYINAAAYNHTVDGIFIVPSEASYMRISGRIDYPIVCYLYRYVKNDRLVYSIPPNIKYPKLLTDRGCLSFQMDVNHTDNPLSNPTYKKMLAILREYGIMVMDFSLMPFQINHSFYNIGADTALDIEWFRRIQSEGCEIIFHTDSIVGNNTDISNSSTLTVEEAKEGLNNDLNIIKTGGFMPYGIVALNGEIKSDFIPFVNKQFLWTTFGNARIQDFYNWHTYKSSYLDAESPEYHRICRTSFEINLASASESDIETMIQRGKTFIDTICNNKCMGTIYCHSYNNPNVAYSLPQEVLLELCAYIKEKVADGLLVTGTTTECLNYLCSK